MIISIYLECCHFMATFYRSIILCFYLLEVKTFCLFVFYSLLTYIYYAPKFGKNPIPMRYCERYQPAFRGSVVCAGGSIFVLIRLCHMMVSCARIRFLWAAYSQLIGGVGATLAVSTVKLHPPETLGGAAFFTGIPMPLLFTPNYLGELANLTTPSDER
jgi:hypothetical protein